MYPTTPMIQTYVPHTKCWLLIMSQTTFIALYFLQIHSLPITHHRLVKIKEWIDSRDPNALIIPFSGALELKVLHAL